MTKPLPHPLTKSQAEALLLAAAADPNRHQRERDSALLVLMLHGLRVSEALHIQAEDINLGRGTDNPFLFVRGGKGGKDRRVPLSFQATNVLRRYMATGTGILIEGPLFNTGPRATQKMIKRRAREANLPRVDLVTPHTLRHTFAVACLKSGMNLRTLQVMLGHEDLSTTEEYLLIDGSDVEHEVARVGGMPF